MRPPNTKLFSFASAPVWGVFCLLVLLVSASPAMARGALPLNDVDGDGWSDNFENATGSSPASPLKTPESIATSALSDQQPYQAPEKPSCLDGKDNDGDGKIDSNFGAADPGCDIPPIETTSFAGANDFAAPVHTEISTIDVPLPFPGNPHCIFKFAGDGGAVVNVDPPVAGTAAAEVIAVQIDGVAEVTGPVTCPLGIGYKNAIQIIEDPNAASPGTFTDNNPDPGSDFPATAQVDLHAVLISPLGSGGFSGVPLTNNNVTQIPPYCSNCDLNNPANDCFSAGLLKMCLMPPATDADIDLDNFKQYQIKAPKFPAQNVTLQDAYGGPQSVVVKKPTHLSTPVEDDAVGRPDHRPRCPPHLLPGQGAESAQAVPDRAGGRSLRSPQPDPDQAHVALHADAEGSQPGAGRPQQLRVLQGQAGRQAGDPGALARGRSSGPRARSRSRR